MQATDRAFDLVLSYPQWQGSGGPQHLHRGAMAAAHAYGAFGPLVRVAEAGEGEARGGIHRWSAIAVQFRSAQAILAARQPRRILTAGGDCACDIAIIDYPHRQYPDLLDANTVDTAPSGNIHGMPVATIMGSAPTEMQAWLSAPLPPAQFRYLSAFIGDEGDWQFQKAHAPGWGGTRSAGRGSTIRTDPHPLRSGRIRSRGLPACRLSVRPAVPGRRSCTGAQQPLPDWSA